MAAMVLSRKLSKVTRLLFPFQPLFRFDCKTCKRQQQRFFIYSQASQLKALNNECKKASKMTLKLVTPLIRGTDTDAQH